MYIQCTKKLLDKLEQPHGALPNPPEPYYCWHASFFEESEQLFVVMMNDFNGEEFFFEVESFKEFNKRVVKEIRLGMKDAGAPAKEISAYIKEGGPLTFGPTSDRSKVAQLSGFTKRMKKFAFMMESLMGIMADPEHREELITMVDEMLDDRDGPLSGSQRSKQKKGVYDNEITPMVALDAELVLTGDKRVKRSFLVPLHVPFGVLHLVLQIGFGWYDSHLHEFSLKGDTVKIGIKLPDMGFGDNSDVLDEHATMLSDYLPAERKFEYLYDFGDDWEHIIKVGEVKNFTGGPFVRCTGGEGSTPPEDCGGMYGYDDLCEVLGDPTHERYEELLDWAGDDFDAGFDQEFINEQLDSLQFVPHPTRS